MRALAAVLVCALTIGGCAAGQRLGAGEYRARGDAACARAQRELRNLPREAQEKKLSLDEASKRGSEIGDQFRETLHELRPPEELQDEHDALVDELDRLPETVNANPDRAREQAAVLERRYAAVGMRGCAARAARAKSVP